MFAFAPSFHLHPLQETRPIAKSIAGIGTSLVRHLEQVLWKTLTHAGCLGKSCDKVARKLLSLSPKPIFLALQTVKRHHYRQAVNYWTYRRARQTTRKDETVSSYVFMVVIEVKIKMKAHLFHTSNPIFIIWLLATSKLRCDTNTIYERAAIWVLSFFVKNGLATTQPHVFRYSHHPDWRLAWHHETVDAE